MGSQTVLRCFDTAFGAEVTFCAMKIALTSHQEKFIEAKMKTGGYISPDEIVREALRVYELVEQDDSDPALASALRHSLRSPLKKYRPGHFSSLAKDNGR